MRFYALPPEWHMDLKPVWDAVDMAMRAWQIAAGAWNGVWQRLTLPVVNLAAAGECQQTANKVPTECLLHSAARTR